MYHPMNYNEAHAVVLIFKQIAGLPDPIAIVAHSNYYKKLGGNASTLFYGEVMNEKAICAILNVFSALAFEQILENDPALISGFYEVSQVTPFVFPGH
jgi:hypothetical protein